MAYNVSETDARELLRLMHEDQGLRQPGFSREFALRIITDLSSWFEPNKYHAVTWLERWEEPKPVEEPPARQAPFSADDIPF